MSERVMAIAEKLSEKGLLGPAAHRFGSPDKVMLVSGGPVTHLAEWSLIAAPATKRVVIRQPSREEFPAAEHHSPIGGDVRLVEETALLLAEVEEWKHGSWYHSVTLRTLGVEDLFEKLKVETATVPFALKHGVGLPDGPFWSGALAYDLVQWTQPLRLQNPPKEGALLAVLWCITAGVVVDHRTDRPCVFGDEGDWVEQASTCLDWTGEKVAISAPGSYEETVTHTDQAHENNVMAVRQGIVEGQVYQVNIGKHWQGEIDHPYAVFQRLMRNNPAPFSAYTYAEDLGFALASSSPESLLSFDGERLSTSPIKGTCPQGHDDTEAARLRGRMIEDEKERAEHRMLVDLMRNDLSQIAVPGSVFVNRFDVESYANVQHLVSHITATIRPNASGASALQALFPGGSITGCPRTMVCAVIDELEQTPRSFWTGSIGYIDVHTGRSAWNILIRTLEAHAVGSRWRASVGAGGGITIASVPKKEVDEAAWKGVALRVAAGWMAQDRAPLPSGALGIHPLQPPVTVRIGKDVGAVRDLEEVVNDHLACGVLFVDNLDSFSLNITDAIAQEGHDVTVLRGRSPRSQKWLDEQALSDLLEQLKPSHIVLGPGPGCPEDVPLTMMIAREALAGRISAPLLGVCLGHQALALADGRSVQPSPLGPVHGVPVDVLNTGTGLFSGMNAVLKLTRYNSLVALDEGSHRLMVNATESSSGLIMGMHHPSLAIHGVQFHPESIGSQEGQRLIANFLSIPSDG